MATAYFKFIEKELSYLTNETNPGYYQITIRKSPKNKIQPCHQNYEYDQSFCQFLMKTKPIYLLLCCQPLPCNP